MILPLNFFDVICDHLWMGWHCFTLVQLKQSFMELSELPACMPAFTLLLISLRSPPFRQFLSPSVRFHQVNLPHHHHTLLTAAGAGVLHKSSHMPSNHACCLERLPRSFGLSVCPFQDSLPYIVHFVSRSEGFDSASLRIQSFSKRCVLSQSLQPRHVWTRKTRVHTECLCEKGLFLPAIPTTRKACLNSGRPRALCRQNPSL